MTKHVVIVDTPPTREALTRSIASTGEDTAPARAEPAMTDGPLDLTPMSGEDEQAVADVVHSHVLPADRATRDKEKAR